MSLGQLSGPQYEQTINYICKSEQERKARPGMYTTWENVMNMSDCVAGAYIYYYDTGNSTPYKNGFNGFGSAKGVTMDLVIQVDDILPLSAMSYYPRFMFGDLTLELSANVIQNMVFMQVPPSVVQKRLLADRNATRTDMFEIPLIDGYIDFKFTQCGDYAHGVVCLAEEVTGGTYQYTGNVPGEGDAKYTIEVSNLVITEAKSFINGFNIKQKSKENLLTKFQDKPLMIPGQWIEHYNFSQMPTSSNMRCNIILPLWNASQIIATFPNSSNQLTVSNNPHLESVQMHINDRILPDKFVTTLDHAHSEMILNALGLDSLFCGAPELINSLTYDESKLIGGSRATITRDQSDYMFVANLERFGSGCFCDGMNAMNCPITLSANYINGTSNPHYYPYKDGTTRQFSPQNVNLFVVSDCFWVCTTNGIDLVKDQM